MEKMEINSDLRQRHIETFLQHCPLPFEEGENGILINGRVLRAAVSAGILDCSIEDVGEMRVKEAAKLAEDVVSVIMKTFEIDPN